jgi:hypothetical protein
MRQKFEAEQPDEMDRNNQSMDRSQGAARAISVRISLLLTNYISHNMHIAVFHRPRAVLGRHEVVQEHNKDASNPQGSTMLGGCIGSI